MDSKNITKIKLDETSNERIIQNDKLEIFEKHNFGTSALHGRTQRNVTFHQRGAYDETKFDNAFPGAYFNILKSAFRMATMFFRSK